MSDITARLEDIIQPFDIEGLGVMGRLVRLGPALDAILAPHDYPAPVKRLLAETITLAATLSSVLKFDGIFTLQAQAKGPVSLLLADITSEGALRAYARFDPDRLPHTEVSEAPVKDLLGEGYLAFTVDQGPETDRYQGITELVGETLAECADTYLRQSEQLESAIMVCSRAEPFSSSALMLQRLPGDGGVGTKPATAEGAWEKAVVLMQSMTAGELLDPSLSASNLLYRLYHQDGVRVYPQKGLYQKCRCSAEKVARTLKSFPKSEIEDMATDGAVTVTCEFCRADYRYEPAQLDALFADLDQAEEEKST